MAQMRQKEHENLEELLDDIIADLGAKERQEGYDFDPFGDE